MLQCGTEQLPDSGPRKLSGRPRTEGGASFLTDDQVPSYKAAMEVKEIY